MPSIRRTARPFRRCLDHPATRNTQQYEFAHLIRQADHVDVPVDLKTFAHTCAGAITHGAFTGAAHTGTPEPALEEFIVAVVAGSKLNLVVVIGALAVLERHTGSALSHHPHAQSYPNEGGSYWAHDGEEACRAFLGAYMAAAMLLAADSADDDVHTTTFWRNVTRGEYEKEELCEMEMLFADSVREVEVGSAQWARVEEEAMWVHRERERELRYAVGESYAAERQCGCAPSWPATCVKPMPNTSRRFALESATTTTRSGTIVPMSTAELHEAEGMFTSFGALALCARP